ncbi:MAG: hypothetical protein ACLP9L_34730 [Thermoguttaceae bacterium]
MLSRPQIPPPGSPLPPPGSPGALGQVLTEIASAAAREDAPNNGLVGRAGTYTAPPPQTSIALFQLTGNFNDDDLADGQTWPFQPDASWFHANATRVEYYSGAQQWDIPLSSGDSSSGTSVPETACVWHNAGCQIDSVDHDREMPAAMQGSGQFMPAVGSGAWVWCFYDEGPGCWVVLQPFEDIIRVQLTTNWYACCKADANILIATGDAPSDSGSSSSGTTDTSCVVFNTGYTVACYDTVNAITNDPNAVFDPILGLYYIPSGNTAVVKRFADDNAWEPLRFSGAVCTACCGSSSSYRAVRESESAFRTPAGVRPWQSPRRWGTTLSTARLPGSRTTATAAIMSSLTTASSTSPH